MVLLFLGAIFFALPVTLYSQSLTPSQLQADAATKAAREYEKRIQEEQQRLQEKLQTERAIKDVFLQGDQTKQELQATLGDSCIKVSLIAVQGVNQLLILTLIPDINARSRIQSICYVWFNYAHCGRNRLGVGAKYWSDLFNFRNNVFNYCKAIQSKYNGKSLVATVH